MTWNEYYDKFWDWAESTQIKKLSSVECDGKSSEILEVASSFSDDHAVTRLIKKSVEAGVQFTADEIIELSGFISEEAFDALISHAQCQFTDNQLEELLDCTGNEYIKEIAKRQGSEVFSTYEEELEYKSSRSTTEKGPGKLFAAGSLFGMLIGTQKKSRAKFCVGEHVRVRYRGQEGTVVDINGNYYMVSLDDGSKVDSYTESQLEKAW
jgi:hypothetical protein